MKEAAAPVIDPSRGACAGWRPMKNSIVAKMKCTSVRPGTASELVSLDAVDADSAENRTFSEATPQANLSMTITNPAAHGAFQPGKEYYVRFEEAGAAAPAPAAPGDSAPAIEA